MNRKPVTRRPMATVGVLLLAILAGSLALGSTSASAAVESYRSASEIGLPGNGTVSPYPSTINVPPMAGVVTGVTVTFHGFSHGSAQSVHALLVSPDGRKSILMAGSCATTQASTLLIFSDQGHGKLPAFGPCDGIVYHPTDNTLPGFPGFGNTLPDGPYGANMNNFLGATPEGAWRLYIKGYGGAKSGKIAEGWSLTLETRVPDAVVPTGASGEASSYPLTRGVSGLDGLVSDVNVSVPGVFHQNAGDLEMMLVSPRGQHAVLMSDVCSGDARYETWRFDDESSNFMSVEDPCPSGTYKPVGRSDTIFPGRSFPTTVPTALSNFDGTEPNGEWALYVFDDHPSDGKGGLFLNRFDLQIETRPKAALQFATPALDLPEGRTGELRVTRSAGATQPVRAVVAFVATPGTASADDYRLATQSIEFAPGQTEAPVKLEALADTVSDPGETFEVKVAFAGGDAAPTGATAATVTIREAPRGGTGGPTTGGAPPPDLLAPDVTGLRLAPKRFRVSRARTARVARVRRGTRIRYTLSEAATVQLRFQRARPRRRSGKRWVAAGSLRRTGIAGVNRVRFSGRVGRRKLRPGVYRVLAKATDAAGNVSVQRRARFRIVR